MHGAGFSSVPYIIAPTGTAIHRGQTPAGVEATGTASSWAVTSPDFELSLLDVQWANGERSVHAGSVARGRQAVRHLETGHRRLGAHPAGTSLWVELRMARIDPSQANEWTTLVTATPEAWSRLHGPHWSNRLSEAFGLRIGLKSDLIGATDRTRNRLCALIPKLTAGNALPHVFILTRAIPLSLGMKK